MTTRHILQQVDPCEACNGTGRRRLSPEGDGILYTMECTCCRGSGETLTVVDADEWLMARLPVALERIGMVAEDWW